jgi:hypothetical protein
MKKKIKVLKLNRITVSNLKLTEMQMHAGGAKSNGNTCVNNCNTILRRTHCYCTF